MKILISILKLLIPILGMACTVWATVTSLAFCMAAGANSTPVQSRALNLWMIGMTLLGVAGVVVSVMLIRAGKPIWASVAAIAPTVILPIIVIIALQRQ